jgi:hemoglobin-like flavoprotein
VGAARREGNISVLSNVTATTGPAPLTSEQIALVRESFALMALVADEAASQFYDRLFDLDPSLRLLFRTDMRSQRRAMMDMIAAAVEGLDRLDELMPAVQALGRRHTGYGVRAEHYATVGEALLWTLEQGLGDIFTPAVADAWGAVYALLAGAMQQAAAA